MTNRLIEKLKEAHSSRRKLFCAFLTLGYPSLGVTEKLIEGFSSRGVDLIELGFPFSDPMADGPTIQFSSEKALERGVRMEDSFRLVRRLRKRGIETPIIFFSYLNPIYHFGVERFPRCLKEAGFDGLIVPDCPPEEDVALWRASRRAGIAPAFLVAPTTTLARARKIFARSRGFLYYVSVRGVTGARGMIPADLASNLKRLRHIGGKSVLVGFGVSTPQQVRRISREADGVIVGSAIVDRIRRSGGKTAPVLSYVASLTRALRTSEDP